MVERKVRKVITGDAAYDGAGVKLVRVLGRRDVEDFDPFLMLDAFDSYDSAEYSKGFPWHPHRGIETVTYLIEGCIEHRDSLGNAGIIGNGECQWMTAGKAIIHQEMPQESRRLLGVQLWLNLPRKDKMTEPKYRDITSNMIPVVEEDGNVIKIISGDYGQTPGAIQGDYVNMRFLDVLLPENQPWDLSVKHDATVFIYIVEGSGILPGKENEQISIEEKSAVLFDRGEQFRLQAGKQGIRFLLFEGQPLQEPVAWGGPIVMNTQEELQQAFKEIEEGTFVHNQQNHRINRPKGY